MKFKYKVLFDDEEDTSQRCRFQRHHYHHWPITTPACLLTTIIRASANVHPWRSRYPSGHFTCRHLFNSQNLSSRYYYYVHFMNETRKNWVFGKSHPDRELGKFESCMAMYVGGHLWCFLNSFTKIQFTYQTIHLFRVYNWKGLVYTHR